MTILTIDDMPQASHVPSHPDYFEVRFVPGDFQSSLHSVKNFKAEDLICTLSRWIPGSRTRTSFQCGEMEHLEFNTDIVFANHTCDPNVGLDLSSSVREDWSVYAIKDIAIGDEVTWFYPSTEWDAWGGGFACDCSSKACLKTYTGSISLSQATLTTYKFISPHVWRLARARDQKKLTKPASDSRPIRIAYAYDRRADYLALGFSEEDCAEFDTEFTIDAVAASLRKLGYVEMVGNIRSLVSRLAAGAAAEWDLVFNYTEGVRGIGREAQTPGLLEAFDLKFTLSDAATQILCLDKCKTKMVLQFYGVPTAPFAVIPGVSNSTSPTSSHASTFIQSSPHRAALSYPLFAKPAAEGSSKGILPISKINSPEQLEPAIAELMSRFPGQDVVVERYLAGREFNVGILGTDKDAWVFGVVEVVFVKSLPVKQAGAKLEVDDEPDRKPLLLDYLSYDLKNAKNASQPKLVKCDMNDPVVQAVADVGLKAWKVMGCRDAGTVDIRHDVVGQNAVPHVLEVNTIPGLTPDRAAFPLIAAANGISYDELISMMLTSALKR